MDTKAIIRRFSAMGFMMEDAKDLARKIEKHIPPNFPADHLFFDFSRSARIIANQEGLRQPKQLLDFIRKNLDALFEVHDLTYEKMVEIAAMPAPKTEAKAKKQKEAIAEAPPRKADEKRGKKPTDLKPIADTIRETIKKTGRAPSVADGRARYGVCAGTSWTALNARIRTYALGHPDCGFNSLRSFIDGGFHRDVPPIVLKTAQQIFEVVTEHTALRKQTPPLEKGYLTNGFDHASVERINRDLKKGKITGLSALFGKEVNPDSLEAFVKLIPGVADAAPKPA